jgi:formylglycine-generating enzyme required for sulfatase activity
MIGIPATKEPRKMAELGWSLRVRDVVNVREGGGDKLLRGGSWGSRPAICRSAYRCSIPPDDRGRSIGFRVCCLPQH